MADTALKDMLSALSGKIKSLSDGTATAEDTALMGFAVEKIAGQVSALELQVLTDDLKTALSTLAADKTKAINQASVKALSDVADKLAEILEAASASEVAFNENATEKTCTFNTNATSKTTAFNANASAKTALLNAVYSQQFASPALPQGSVTANAKGFFTSFNDGRGKAYSNIEYDTLDRITAWKETISLPDETTQTFTFSATYTGDAIIPVVTRTAV